MAMIFKAHVKGYWRDGVYVREHDTKTPAAKPKWQNKLHSGGPASKAGKHAPSLFMRPKVYPDAAVHPQPDDDGHPVMVNAPDIASDPSSWADPAQLAVFVPGGAAPDELNGVAFAPWRDAPMTDVSWNFVDGQMPHLDEPEMPQANKADGKPKDIAAGVIIEESDGRVWLICPTNGFGGYDATFPKGRVEDGLALQASAIKEAFEESGLQVAITGFWGDIERSQTVARYYTATRVGGTPAAMGWESQAVKLAPKDQLRDLLNAAVDHKLLDIQNKT